MHTILIADQHTLCREALCNYIREAAPHEVRDVESYEALIQSLDEARPDLILVEHGLFGWTDADTQAFTEKYSPAKLGIIIPLQSAQPPHAHVSGFFPKSLSCKAFLAGIEDVLEGRGFFPSSDDRFVAPGHSPAPRQRDFSFTAREREVLSYLVRGLSNKDIARALDLQVVTVKLHVRGVCRKMKAANRTQAAVLAKENGWD